MTTAESGTLAGIALGANLGNRADTLLAAWQELGDIPGVQTKALSSPYLSAPFAMQSERQFVNAVGLVQSIEPPEKLLALLLEIEARHGRRRNPQTKGYQDRPLDLDLLFYGDLVTASKMLTLPHPRLHERLFVLAPLAELLPDWLHPGLHTSAREFLNKLRTFPDQQIEQSDWQVLTAHPENAPVRTP